MKILIKWVFWDQLQISIVLKAMTWNTQEIEYCSFLAHCKLQYAITFFLKSSTLRICRGFSKKFNSTFHTQKWMLTNSNQYWKLVSMYYDYRVSSFKNAYMRNTFHRQIHKNVSTFLRHSADTEDIRNFFIE